MSAIDDRVAGMSRRELIAAISTVGAAAALGLPERAAAAPVRIRQSLASAAAVAPHGSDLGAIEHVVFLMMENRSYDHFFGAYHRGRGFDDHPKHSLGAFAQHYPKGTTLHPKGKLLPFHLDPALGEDCTKDLTHNWGPQHECWNHGKMNRYVVTHTAKANEGNPNGALTMGYYTRHDIPYYWALADHFTLCDRYFASVLGPTHPNRLMSISGTIDPHGTHGGPITDTNFSPDYLWSCTWSTVQEQLEDKGVPWKVYHPSNANLTPKYAQLAAYPTWDPAIYDPTTNQSVLIATDHVLPYFKAFENPATALHQKAFSPTFPNDFVSDIAAGTLPSVSWIIPPLGFDDHPCASPERGMYFVKLVVDALTANKAVWSKTALFVMYDENDGWFDHVSPPTPPKHTHREYLTAKHISADTNGFREPIGLGVRVPMLVVSPFSRGGHLSGEVFDHTSQLKLLSERFGIELQHVSHWRRKTVGDLTSALFRGKRDMSMPALPNVVLAAPQATGSCSEDNQDAEFLGGSGPTIPTHQRMPTQRGTTVAASHYFPSAADAQPSTARVPLTDGRDTSTTKSRMNRLAADGPDARRALADMLKE
jgi:phospholipase C